MRIHTDDIEFESGDGTTVRLHFVDLTCMPETLEELKQRAAKFLEWVKREYPDKVVLAVGHGIINKAVQSVFYGKPMNEIAVMKNADVRILKIE